MSSQLNTVLVDVKNEVDKRIEERLNRNDDHLIEALYKSALYSASGGKRIRAVFVFLVGRLFDIDSEKLLSSATAVELVHAASLIMGDLPYMDDSQLRRGKPANHVVFGQDVALLASIGLLSEAIKIINEDNRLNELERNKTTLELTTAFGLSGLAAGAFIDLKLNPGPSDMAIIEYVNEKKTAALFIAGAKITGHLGNASSGEMEALNDYARNIGFALRFLDDLLESRKFKENQQEPPVKNLALSLGEEKLRDYLTGYQKKAGEALAVFGNKADELKAFNEYLVNRV